MHAVPLRGPWEALAFALCGGATRNWTRQRERKRWVGVYLQVWIGVYIRSDPTAKSRPRRSQHNGQRTQHISVRFFGASSRFFALPCALPPPPPPARGHAAAPFSLPRGQRLALVPFRLDSSPCPTQAQGVVVALAAGVPGGPSRRRAGRGTTKLDGTGKGREKQEGKGRFFLQHVHNLADKPNSNSPPPPPPSPPPHSFPRHRGALAPVQQPLHGTEQAQASSPTLDRPGSAGWTARC